MVVWRDGNDLRVDRNFVGAARVQGSADLRADALTLDRMGLSGVSMEAFLDLLENGFPASAVDETGHGGVLGEDVPARSRGLRVPLKGRGRGCCWCLGCIPLRGRGLSIFLVRPVRAAVSV